MLRAFLIVASAALLVTGLIIWAMGGAAARGPVLAVWALVTLVGVLFERALYRRLLDAPPGPDWRETPEKFIDPTTGTPVVVYVQPDTGRRAYVKI